jgi:saccharopine dehydrogenase (NAD+, L-lysine-forming)
MKIGILREEKNPHDKRVPFIPSQCTLLKNTFPDIELKVQSSDYRCYTDQEYINENIFPVEDLADCDVLMGIKEVPPEKLMEGKHYFFFSHTIKKQLHNRNLLKEIIRKKITLTDYETLTDINGNRIIGFGRFAGIVGAYNGVMAYGLMYGLFKLKPAHLCHDKKEVFKELDNIHLPNMKIVVTGGGRVANGACETMGALNIRKVTPYEFLNYSFREPVYVQLHSHDYYRPKDGSPWSDYNFHHHPSDHDCIFSDPDSFASKCDLLIHCTFWDPNAPVLFTKADMRNPDFKISVIADVTCDINGSIPSTMMATTIEDKFYGYNPQTEEIEKAFAPDTITVMSIDNLPCELPRDSSDGFGKHLLERVMPSIINAADPSLIERATIVKGGKLTERFLYLTDYIS